MHSKLIIISDFGAVYILSEVHSAFCRLEQRAGCLQARVETNTPVAVQVLCSVSLCDVISVNYISNNIITLVYQCRTMIMQIPDERLHYYIIMCRLDYNSIAFCILKVNYILHSESQLHSAF